LDESVERFAQRIGSHGQLVYPDSFNPTKHGEGLGPSKAPPRAWGFGVFPAIADRRSCAL